MTIAEYIARLKTATQVPGKTLVNLIYGADGNVVGNSAELLKVAELLLQERDEAIGLLKRWVNTVDETPHDEPWGDHPAVDKEQLLFTAGNSSDSECAGPVNRPCCQTSAKRDSMSKRSKPDFDGLVSGFKHIIDSLVECGVLKSDKPSCIGQPKFFWEKGAPGKGKIKVKVEGK